MEFPKKIERVKEPARSASLGRLWDICGLFLPDGTDGRAYYETTRGTRFYFQYRDQWYRGPIDMYDVGEVGRRIVIDLRKA